MPPPRTLLAYSAPRSGFGDEWMTFLPIGLGYLQAMLKSRSFPCRVANLSGKGRKEVLAYFRAQDPAVLGISMFTFNRKRSYELLTWAREACPSAILLAGGPHPTHLAEEVFEDCPALDAIVQGEGETVLLGLVERLRTAPGSDLWRRTPGLILREGRTLPQPPLEDLDAVGVPAEHLEADFLNDVGQNTWEEVDEGSAGANYGWPATEGATANPAYTGPVYAYPHSGGPVTGCCIVGAAFYDPATPAFPAAFLHKYLFMDLCEGWVRTLDPATGTVGDWLTGFSSPVDLRVAGDGSVLVLSRGGGGTLQRVTYATP